MLAARTLWVVSCCVLCSAPGALYGCSEKTPPGQNVAGAPPGASGNGGGGALPGVAGASGVSGGTMMAGGTAGQAGQAGNPAQAGSVGQSGAPNLAGAAGTGGVEPVGGTGGASAGASAVTLKQPVVRNNRCVLEFGQSYFESDPAVAGRILSAKSGALEALVPSSVHAQNYGSTFWTAPQSDWNWPPVATIDTSAYTPVADDTSCTMTSAKVAGVAQAVMNDIVIAKKFSADLGKEAMVVEYTIRNEGTAAKRFAPWEITRVAPDGLTFFATDAQPTGSSMPPVTTMSGAIWYKDAASVAHNAKLFCDGKGWIAHVTPQNLLLLKSFPDVPVGQAAPSEAEIEIYTSNPPAGMAGAARYVEVENLGVYTDIAPGASLTWTVRWYVRTLPPNVMATAGNPELLALVQSLLAP